MSKFKTVYLLFYKDFHRQTAAFNPIIFVGFQIKLVSFENQTLFNTTVKGINQEIYARKVTQIFW